MASQPKNRNALRSKRMLVQAFSQLLLEMPYEKITVSQIARRAELNRGTFYAHYNNVDDLAQELIDDITEKLFEVVHQASTATFPRNPEPVLARAGEHIMKDVDLYRLLVATEDADVFLASVKRRIADELSGQVGEGGGALCNEDEHIAVIFVSSGLVDVCVSWLRGECGDMSMEELVAHACTLVKLALAPYA